MKAADVDTALDAGALELPGLPKCAFAKGTKVFLDELKRKGNFIEQIVLGWAVKYVNSYIKKNCA